MKNLLDWMVSSLEFPNKPVAIINASRRAFSADAHLRLTLQTMSACLDEEASITLPQFGRNLNVDGIFSDTALSAQLRADVDSFARFIGAKNPA